MLKPSQADALEPLLHGIGDVGGRADLRRAGETGTEVELANRGLLPPHPLDELGAEAAHLLAAQRAVGHRLVQRMARQVAKRAVERAEPGQRVDQRLQLVVLRLRFGAGAADDRTKRRHDLQVVGLTAVFRHPPLHIGVVGARVLERAADRVDDLGGRAPSSRPCSEAPACTITGWPCGMPATFNGPRTLKNRPW